MPENGYLLIAHSRQNNQFAAFQGNIPANFTPPIKTGAISLKTTN